jgi:hypothetical protein
MLSFLLLSFSLWASVQASVTVYSQAPIGVKSTSSSTASGAAYTGPAAYDPTVLQAPPVPNPAPPTTFTLTLQQQSNAVSGLSIPQSGAFYGFSVEMSVVTQICERPIFTTSSQKSYSLMMDRPHQLETMRKSLVPFLDQIHLLFVLRYTSSFLKVPMLNLLSNVAERAGHVNIRVGGNTQDTAVFVGSIPDGHAIEKQQGVTNNPASGHDILRPIMTITNLSL